MSTYLLNNISRSLPDAVSQWGWIRKALARSFFFLFLLVLVTGLILYKLILFTSMSLTPSFWMFYGVITTIYLVSRIPYAYLYEDDHSLVYPDSTYPNVSIIIAVKNEQNGIFDTIHTCIEQKYPGKMECIVINDGSTDETKYEIKKAQIFFGDRVKSISFPENRGKKEAMAVGIKNANHELIIFVDSDTYLEPNAVRHIAEHFLADEKIGAVSANTKVENSKKNLLTRMQTVQYAVSFNIYKASESIHRSVTCCPGCFSAYRKSAIESLVDTWKNQKFLGTKGSFGDDRSLTNFVLQEWDVIFCEKAKATTNVPEKIFAYWRQQLRWKKSWIRESYFASKFMWKKKHPFAFMAFYTNLSFFIVGPILVVSVIMHSFNSHSLIPSIIFVLGFMLLGLVFALFLRVYRGEENWIYMPLFSLMFVLVFIWQMPYALLTLKKTHWGTR